MALRLIYQMCTKLLSWIVLRTRSDTSKEIEILVLRRAPCAVRRAPCAVCRVPCALVFRSFLALSPVRGSRGHAGDEWFVDLGG